MQVKSRLYNFIACLKFFMKSHKGAFIYPLCTRRILVFLNTLWRSGFIFGYKIVDYTTYVAGLKLKSYKHKPIVVHLKTYWSNYRDPSPAFLITISRAARPRYISHYTLETYYKKRDQQTIFLLFTCFGLVTSEEILNLKLGLGGTALCKFV